MIGKRAEEEWIKLPAECFETLTFGDLKQGRCLLRSHCLEIITGMEDLRMAYIFKKLKTPVNSDSIIG